MIISDGNSLDKIANFNGISSQPGPIGGLVVHEIPLNSCWVDKCRKNQYTNEDNVRIPHQLIK